MPPARRKVPHGHGHGDRARRQSDLDRQRHRADVTRGSPAYGAGTKAGAETRGYTQA